LDRSKKPLTYRDAGVDIDAGDALVEAIKPLARSTNREGCVSGIGGFGALFQVPTRYRDPILVSGTDGVGTKLKLAFQLQRHDTIGIDLVAMCANDVVVQGAEPLFFLDYFATGRLDRVTATQVLTGIAHGCRLAGCALIGGETAEMPGMYPAGEYDLAGFCVGAVEKDRLLDGTAARPGDAVIGISSSGPHSNGYSLIRKVIADHGVDVTMELNEQPLADLLLAPTRIYVKPLLDLLDRLPVRAIAHITGGGLPGNVVRVLPEGCRAEIDADAWKRPAIFDWIQQTAGIEDNEMYKTFNCGIGMVLVVAPDQVDAAVSCLRDHGETPFVIGRITAGDGPATLIING